jgi:exopolyphosphatase/guanosine-5'-triphosphate,3'-diphosphate pyrophosphatase
MEKIAIIDMGSNTIRMVIYQVADDSFHLIDDTKETVRLSERMGEERTLKPEAINRALGTLTRFMKICRSRGVTTVIPVATAAVRRAANQQEYLQLVERETGLAFRVLSGQEEGYYGFLGVLNGFTLQHGFTLDIGGGSSEITHFTDRTLRHSVSMSFGALTLTEAFRHADGKLAVHEVRSHLRSAYQAESWISGAPGHPLIGLGGTVRNIARIHRAIINYPLESAHHYAMSKQQVDDTMNYISSLSLKQLQSLPGLSKDRADIIVAGGLIIQTLMEASKAPLLFISGNGLREGLFYEYYQRHYGQSSSDVLLNDVYNLMRYYHVDVEHSRHVAHLAVRLFDELAILHGYGESERRLLWAAAHLHDVGVAVNFYDWQKHTFYVLLHSKLVGLTHRERLLVALIASFKNKKKSRELAEPYQMLLASDDEDRVQKLGILLLMARALDRALSNDIQDVICDIQDKKLKIRVQSIHPDIRLELKEAGEFQQKFEKSFGREYSLEADIIDERPNR